MALARQDLVGAEQLLQQHDARKLVRKRDRAEATAALSARSMTLGSSPNGPPTTKHRSLPVVPPLLEKGGELLLESWSPSRSRTQTNAGRDPRRIACPPGDGLGAPPVGPRLAQLDRLQPRLAREQPLVVSDVVGEGRTAQPADADEAIARRHPGAILVSAGP